MDVGQDAFEPRRRVEAELANRLPAQQVARFREALLDGLRDALLHPSFDALRHAFGAISVSMVFATRFDVVLEFAGLVQPVHFRHVDP